MQTVARNRTSSSKWAKTMRAASMMADKAKEVLVQRRITLFQATVSLGPRLRRRPRVTRTSDTCLRGGRNQRTGEPLFIHARNRTSSSKRAKAI